MASKQLLSPLPYHTYHTSLLLYNREYVLCQYGTGGYQKNFNRTVYSEALFPCNGIIVSARQPSAETEMCQMNKPTANNMMMFSIPCEG